MRRKESKTVDVERVAVRVRYVVVFEKRKKAPGGNLAQVLYWNGMKFADDSRGRRFLTRYVAEREAASVVLCDPKLVGNVEVREVLL